METDSNDFPSAQLFSVFEILRAKELNNSVESNGIHVPHQMRF